MSALDPQSRKCKLVKLGTILLGVEKALSLRRWETLPGASFSTR